MSGTADPDCGDRGRSLAGRRHGAGRSDQVSTARIGGENMTAPRDKFGRPIVVVTGMGVVTSLGAGKADNWTKLTAGESGIRTITRFPTDGLKTTMAGTVDFVPVEPFSSTDLSERLADIATEEAIAQSGIGTQGRFSRAAVSRRRAGRGRMAAAARTRTRDRRRRDVDYDALLRVSGGGKFTHYHRRFLFGSVADHLAEKFGTKGSPISLSTACASGATAIQLGVEAIRRGEADAALCVATDGSVNPEALVRFSLLSALSTQNDPPQAASKPFSKNRDGFVMAEGAGALVLESYEAATARGAKILGVARRLRRTCGLVPPHPLEPRRQADHRLRAQRTGRCRHDAGADRLHQRARHRDAGKRQDGISRHLHGVRRAHQADSGVVQQVDGRPHPLGGRRGRSGVLAADARASADSADHQLRHSGSRRFRSTSFPTRPATRASPR